MRNLLALPAREVNNSVLAIRRDLNHRKIILGLDRLDYTKGILERLAGFRALLEKEPSLRGEVTLLQLVVPSRESIPQYQGLRDSIERSVSQINAEFGMPGWNPVSYWHRCIPRSELLALYRAADVALITPIRDGMNLVAKEFCACRVDNNGALVLSEFAGAANELREGALLVNPYDTDGIAEALWRALRMSTSEQRFRMQKMRGVIAKADVFAWCRAIWRETGFIGLPREVTPDSISQLQATARAV